MVKTILFLLLCCCFEKLYAQQLRPDERDIIQFYNGDQLIGEIKSVQRGELEFDPDRISENITLKLRDIKHLRSRNRKYLVEDVNNVRHYGILDISPVEGMVHIITATDTISMFLEDIALLTNMDDNFWRRLNGNISLGFSYTKSSNIGRINGSNTLSYSTRLWEWRLNGDIIYTIDEDYKGVEKADVALGAYIEFWKKWYSVTQVQYQRITELGINARAQVLEGLGPILIKNRHNDLRAGTGISGQVEFSGDTSTAQQSLEIPLFINYYLFRLARPEIKLQVGNMAFFSLTTEGRWRNDQSVTLSWKPVSHLLFELQLYSNFDSKPPSKSAQKMDYGLVFSVGYSF